MLCSDLIITICEYLKDPNYYLLNKSLYESIVLVEKGDYWKQKYNNFFKDLDKEYLILNGNYNWKREYLRVIKFNHWSDIKNTTEIGNLINQKQLFVSLSNNEAKEFPKKIGNLINLTRLEFTHYRNFQYPKELHDLCYSIYKKSGEFYM